MTDGSRHASRLIGLGYGLRRKLLTQQWFTSSVLPSIPRPLRWGLRRAYFLPFDILESVSRKHDDMVPPKSAIFTGSVDDFKASGDALVGRLVDLAGLSPGSRVLDIGSGMGRAAIALTSYLDSSGSYEGLDIVPSGVKWCSENITPKHPRFTFTLADVYNKEYQPTGRLPASELSFPYGDQEFDLVLLASVFTHMLPDDMEHYLAEIDRVLKKGGRCYASFSLLDIESKQAMSAGASSLLFKRFRDECWVVDPKVPELAVGYEEDYVRKAFRRQGLSEDLQIHHGGWAPRASLTAVPSFSQDIVVATKP